MKIFITKYALSGGITEVEGEENIGGYIWAKGYSISFSPKDYSFSRTEAELKAEEMKVKKIESLKKQIRKLEKMNFITYPK